MILHGLTLTVVGMTVVFIFLTLLVYSMKLLSAIVTRFAPENLPSARVQKRQETIQPAGQPITQISSDAEIAAVLAAVNVFTNK